MLRWLFYVILALWVSRLVRMIQPRKDAPSPRRQSDFPPRAGEGHPSRPASAIRDGQFPAGEIVDAEYEDLPARPRS